MDYVCKRCGYVWTPKKSNPKQCPQCHSWHWRSPRPADITTSNFGPESGNAPPRGGSLPPRSSPGGGGYQNAPPFPPEVIAACSGWLMMILMMMS